MPGARYHPLQNGIQSFEELLRSSSMSLTFGLSQSALPAVKVVVLKSFHRQPWT